MNEPIVIRHVVSLAGVVREPLLPNAGGGNQNGNGRPPKREPLRIANALIEIIVDDAPAAFQMMVATRQADPAWRNRRERIDRTWSQADGVFHFQDLPPGTANEHYRLRVSVPAKGSRYGVVETDPLIVHANPEGQPVQVAWAEIVLTPTHIHGIVTRLDNGAAKPVAGAKVQLRGESRSVLTKDDGSYLLIDLVAGHPTLVISTAEFTPFVQQLDLAPGQDVEVNVQLS